MAADLNTLGACLGHLDAILPSRYAQWLVEDAITWDYRVAAERIPPGTVGYAIAHRTGVVGQVFRTRRAIFVPDTRSHPLYDPFDTGVDWELAIPVCQKRNLVAVLNLEGSGVLGLEANQWQAIAQLVLTATGWSIEESLPDPAEGGLVDTRLATFRALLGPTGDAGRILKIGRRLARRGRTVLVIGVLPEVARPNSLTVSEAEARGVPLAECFYGMGPGRDILQLGSPPDGMRAFERLGGWALVEGRYEFVLVME